MRSWPIMPPPGVTTLRALGAPPLRLHYLPLPIAFRSRGGFGTHWMYADAIRVSNPLLPRLGNRLRHG